MSNSRRLFGTDGIRGKANTDPMTAETALRLGQAAGLMFTRGSHRHKVVIGKDTRLSGYMIEPALTAGFTGAGMDVTLVGPLPTPAIAMLTRSMRCDLGVMISASHNPYEDNGIKLFGPDGFKLSDETEAEIEALMATDIAHRLAPSQALGRAVRLEDAAGRYIEAAKGSFPRGLRLQDLKIVVDCANGAAYRVAPTVLWELGATVIPVGVTPDGFNINKGCGSTVPDYSVRPGGGAWRGPWYRPGRRRRSYADRGRQRGADRWRPDPGAHRRLLGCRRDAPRPGGRRHRDVQPGAGAFSRRPADMALYRTQVGDRYVAEQMRECGCNVGGEQSGHIILSDLATTGDGLLAALQVLAVIVEQGRPVSEVCRVFAPLPQRLKNVRFSGLSPLRSPRIQQAIAAAEAELQRLRAAAYPRKRHRAAGAGHGRGGGRDVRCAAGRCPVRRNRRGRPGERRRGLMHGRVLVVAGSDSGGGAGIQADIKTITALGAYAATAITAVTAQNTLGVAAVHLLPADLFRLQMTVVLDDIGADAIKIGMLGNAEAVEAVCRRAWCLASLAGRAGPGARIDQRFAVVSPGCVGRVETALAADGDRRHPQCAGGRSLDREADHRHCRHAGGRGRHPGPWCSRGAAKGGASAGRYDHRFAGHRRWD